MFLQISQKYFSIGDKFRIVDENDQPKFLAQERLFRLRRNAHLFSLNNMEICRMEARIFRILPYYDLLTGDNIVGFIKRRFELIPFVNVWYMEYNGAHYALRSAGYHCKICPAEVVGKKFKHNRKEPIATVGKKVMKVRDTYVVEFDEKILDPAIAALVGLWMDTTYHKKQH